jgi:hypothetical protein
MQKRQCPRLLIVLRSVLPEGLCQSHYGPLCPPPTFRTMFTTAAPILALITQSVDCKHWNAVCYLVKADVDGWVVGVAAHDQLKPFSGMMMALAEEPHPLPIDILTGTNRSYKLVRSCCQMVVTITVVGLRRVGRWMAPGFPTDLEQCVATGVSLWGKRGAAP